MRLTGETPWSLQLSVRWRFVGRTAFDNSSAQASLQNQGEGFFDPLLTQLPSPGYLDLLANWAVTGHVQIRAGVNSGTQRFKADRAAFTTASLQLGVSLSMLVWRQASAVASLRPGQSCGFSCLHASVTALSAASQPAGGGAGA